MNSLNKPPPYGLVRDFLGGETVQQLLAFARLNQHLFQDSKVGYGEARKIDKSRRCSSVLPEVGDFGSQVEIKLKRILPNMIERLGGRSFVPHWFEIEMVAHGDGAFFKRHLDLATDKRNLESDRVISCVYYFHAMPKAFSGGLLRLHSLAASEQQNTFVDIEPFCDMLVFFPSWFPHEVLPISCPSSYFIDSRFAINCWIHRSRSPSSA